MKSTGLRSACFYVGLSIIAAGAFLSVTIASDYSWVARIGGTVWVFSLSMIVLMPVVTQMLKRRAD